jgi:hypothetical protein
MPPVTTGNIPVALKQGRKAVTKAMKDAVKAPAPKK